LSVDAAASILGLDVAVITESLFQGSRSVSDAFLARVRAMAPQFVDFFEAQRSRTDLCGAIARFRDLYGVTRGPNEPSVPFSSVVAGTQAAAEVTKLVLRRHGVDAPVLRNVLQLDLAARYTRSALSYAEPARADCGLCQDRGHLVRRIYQERWPS